MKIVTAEQMMRIDRECIESGTPGEVLMENAGRAVAEKILRVFHDVTGRKVVVLAGPGNNGGDGLVAARYLHDWKAEVHLFLFGKKRESDTNFDLVNEREISVLEVGEELPDEYHDLIASSEIVVDALFGTGNNRPLGGVYKKALETVGVIVSSGKAGTVFAVDMPSGLNADTGEADDACLHADHTVTFAFPKTGLFDYQGAERAGTITIADIGIPEKLADDIVPELLTTDAVRKLLPVRPIMANKGTFGKVLVIAGSVNYPGAAHLACSGAIRSGAGLVTLATAIGLHPIVASKLAEATHLPLEEDGYGIISSEAVTTVLSAIGNYDVLLIGCGLGQHVSTKKFIRTLLLENAEKLPVTIIDADALNTLADEPEWWRRIGGNAILTPHPGEMSRLTGKPIRDVQQFRLKTAEEAAGTWKKTIVLKGAYTVIGSPDNPLTVSPFANPGMASAGTGDVLAGVIAGTLAQGIEPFDAALCGVYLHGNAGETVRNNIGDTGMTATDILTEIPGTISKIKNTSRQ